ncbi:O-acetylhomoserine aminocarboxypropyltransferase/cysteine synthase family protein [Lentibacillus sp. N15]|uniref:PLP-dependent aspartate aminotransferase family protein n=1 Tax=Lentibacillus songyuanensis TaxID=3136161 RepID=UPI0031BB163D
MSNFQFHDPETVILHGGQEPDPTTGSRAVPIYQTTSYVFRDTEHAQNLFSLAEPGYLYTRLGNPTCAVFEERVAQLEDGSAAVATSSGMAAITLAILNLAGAGDEIIADSNLYGGTYNLFSTTLPRYGIQVNFVDGTDLGAIRSAITSKTKAIFGETITNPSLNVLDIEGIAGIAHEHHIPLIVDNTFATPYSAQPIKWGADIVIHSATKWIGGHGNSIGGIVVDGGRFDWNHANFPGFIEADESYHGIRYADLGPAAFATKLRVQLLRDIGACLSPHNAFLLLQGLETLHLRVERHNKNAEKVAAYLQANPAVEWVNYPGLENHPAHSLAKKYLQKGFGSMITFGIQGGRDAGRKLINNISIWSHVANVGDAKSLIIHPASTTHQQLSAEDLKKSGVSEELVRLSIGIEQVDDVLSDLDQAIAKATNTKPSRQATKADAVKWLLSSPFIRENGALRQKTIAVVGEGHNEQETNQLKQLGYQLIHVNDTNQLQDTQAAIDTVWLKQGPVPNSTIEQFINKEGKILWIEQLIGTEPTLEHAEAAGITVVTGVKLYEKFVRLRGNTTEQATVSV